MGFSALNSILDWNDLNTLPLQHVSLVLDHVCSDASFILYHYMMMYLQHRSTKTTTTTTSGDIVDDIEDDETGILFFGSSKTKDEIVHNLKRLIPNRFHLAMTNRLHYMDPHDTDIVQKFYNHKIDEGCELLLNQIRSLIMNDSSSKPRPWLFIIDDLNYLYLAGLDSRQILFLLSSLSSILVTMGASLLIKMSLHEAEFDESSALLHHWLLSYSHYIFLTKPLSTGLTKAIDGQLEIIPGPMLSRRYQFKPITNLQYKLSDTNVKIWVK